jgi:hypothetical protein
MAKLCSPAYFCLSNGQPIVESKGALKQAKLDVPTEQVQVGRMIQISQMTNNPNTLKGMELTSSEAALE